MRVIRSPRLVLRSWALEDAAFLLDLESRWETVRYLTTNPARMTSLDEATASILRRRAVDHPVHGIWLITLTETGQPLGNLLLKPVTGGGAGAGAAGGAGSAASATDDDEHPPVEIGWHLHPDAQGHGFATEAARAVLDDAAVRGLEAVVALVHPDNVASQRVCSRLGFRQRTTTPDLVGPVRPESMNLYEFWLRPNRLSQGAES